MSLGLVVEREVRESLRRKGIWSLLALVALVSTAMVVLPSLVGGESSAHAVIVGDGERADALTDALAAIDSPTITIERLPTADAAEQAVLDGDADIAIVAGSPDTILTTGQDATLEAIVAQAATGVAAGRRLTDAGIDPAEVAGAFAAAAPEVTVVDAERGGREAVAFGLVFVLYLLTVILTSQVASAVATEKSNRVSEVLLAIVPARTLLYGKIIGVGLIGLLTIAAGAIPVVVRLLAGGGLPEGVGTTIAVSWMWFAGGLALYLSLAGGLGAMVQRSEEVGAVVMPLTLLLVLGYITAFSIGDSPVGVGLGIFPLTSPLVEPFRIAAGTASFAEAAVSLAVLAVTVVFAVRFAAVVFRRAIVRTGARLKLSDVLRNP